MVVYLLMSVMVNFLLVSWVFSVMYGVDSFEPNTIIWLMVSVCVQNRKQVSVNVSGMMNSVVLL